MVFSAFPEAMEQARFHSYSGPYTAAVGEMESTFVVPVMLQSVIVEGVDPEKAMDEAYEKAQVIFAKHGF